MELKTNSKRAITLIELIVAIVVLSVVFLAAFSVMISQVQYLQIFKQEAALKEDNAYIVDRLRKIVMNSEHVDITASPVGVMLYNRTGTHTGTVALNNRTLTYVNNLALPAPTTETISTSVGSLTFDNGQNPGKTSTVRLLKLALSTSDPSRPAVSEASIITSIACRLTPVLMTVYNVNRNTRYSKIQDALSAPEFQSGDEIRCMGDIRNSGGMFDGMFPENVTIDKSATLKGSYDETFTTQTFDPQNPALGTPTTIDGQTKNKVVNISASSTIDSFIIQNGKTSQSGAGIYVSSVSTDVSIFNNIITGNTSSNYGGGIHVGGTGADKSIIIANNTITGNTGVYTGGICAIGSFSGGSLIIANNFIRDNTSSNSVGGIRVYDLTADSSLIITNNIITGNTGKSTGGINIGGNFTVTSFAITNNIIGPGNTGESTGGIRVGGNLTFTSSTTSTITNNTIIDNTGSSLTNGTGGICVASSFSISKSLAITNNIITENTGGYAGGADILSYEDCSFTITNNIIIGNTGAAVGGIYSRMSAVGSSLTITNNTIAGNTANVGGLCGGLYHRLLVGYLAAVSDSICYGNSPSDLVVTGTIPLVVTHSDIGGSSYPPPPPLPPVPPETNINKAPVFEDEDAGDYHLASSGNDFIIDGGSGGTQMGAYGGPGAGTIGYVPPPSNLTGLSYDPEDYIKENVVGTY